MRYAISPSFSLTFFASRGADMTRNLTEGNPFFLLVRFSIPLILGNFFQQLYNLADAVIVGRYLGINGLSAVGASASINFLILGFCIGVCGGFAIPIAQRFGAQDYVSMRKCMWNGCYLSVLLAVVMTTLTGLMCDDILRWMGTPMTIRQDAYIYQFVIFMGIPFTILYNMTACIIRSLGDSKTPFLFLLIATFGNIFLDLFCIAVLHMGVLGAGLATISSQGLAGVACLIYMMRKYDILKGAPAEKQMDTGLQMSLLGIGLPMGLQSSITAIGSIMLQSAVNALGDVCVAGYAAALKIKMICICPYDAIGGAMATYCGQNMGAGRFDRIRKGIRSGLMIALFFSALGILVLQLFTLNIALLFVDAGEIAVLEKVHQFMFITSFFYPALAFLCTYRYSVQGFGYGRLAMVAGILEMIARTGMSLFVIPRFGFTAVCFTDQTAWILAAAFSTVAFYAIYNKRCEMSKRGQAS